MSGSCRVRNPEVLARGNSRTLRRKAASVASSLSDLPHGRLAGGMTYGGSPGTLLRTSVKAHGMAVLPHQAHDRRPPEVARQGVLFA